MSEHRNKMKRRLEARGDNEGESMRNNAYVFADKNFHKSPSYRRAVVMSHEFPEVEELDIRVMSVERMGDIREVLLRPGEIINIGSYLKFDGETWMVYDRYGSAQAGKVKVMVERCTEKMRWLDKDGVKQEVYCVASATQLGSKANQGKNMLEWNKFDVRLPMGQIFVFIEKNELTETFAISQRFILGSNAYEITGLDDVTSVGEHGYGYVQLTLSVTTRREEDDFADKFAHNEIHDEEEGDRLW